MTVYPTKREILDHPAVHIESDEEILSEWKSQFFNGGKWKNMGIQGRIEALENLIMMLSGITNVILLDEYMANIGDGYIVIDRNNPSIISTLHEIGHIRLGSSELMACCFSVHLFMKIFPKSAKHLVWEGHMLKKA